MLSKKNLYTDENNSVDGKKLMLVRGEITARIMSTGRQEEIDILDK
jgi:hypothetical protein